MRYSAVFAYVMVLFCYCASVEAQPGPAPEARASALQAVASGDMYYMKSGRADGPRIIFVHGTPGAWQAWSDYLLNPQLQCAAQLIAVDRPGFGQLADRSVLTSLKAHAAYLAPLIKSASGKVIIVGHSLGGTIAVRAAADYGDKLAGIVIVAASLSPTLGGPRWYNSIASLPPVNWLLSRSMRRANEEIMPLGEELAILAPQLQNITLPVSIVHGEDDKLVAIKNTDFAESTLQNAKLRIQRIANAGHFILWEQPDVIVNTILDTLGDATTSNLECAQKP